ncbi:putative interleukin-1 receptor-like 1 [Triplophysa rosa]|uniref:Interleukin-1 receptor-like 1 n=1 Tax=Triplophysa rosa TaxID=992332 RepID=A0A9W8C605_TRIRA|nr:putative interleukin-1 receptor-like 1 [Triplophysa rosa]
MLADFALSWRKPLSDHPLSCLRPDSSETLSVRSGESLYLPCPNLDCFEDNENASYVWLKNVSRTKSLEEIGTEEHMRVHYHRSVLYILQLSVEDTGFYITRQFYPDGVCHEFVMDLVVYEEFSTNLLFSSISSVEGIVAEIFCPLCEHQTGTFIWYKNFSLISNQESGQMLRVRDASRESEDIYTCVCFWEHGGRKLNSSASRRLVIEDQSLITPPRIVHPTDNSIVLVDMDAEIGLTCSVFTGSTGRRECTVGWLRNQTALDGLDGYTVEQREDEAFIHSVLLIRKVSQVDFYSVFHCTADYSYQVMLVSVALKRRASRLTLVWSCVCVVFLILMVSGTMKMFAVDLVLLLRGSFKKLNRKEDGKVYDAYVIYQRNNLDEATEKTISDFVTGALPTVLEKYYNYKLYIPARDDLPGEDCMNLLEAKIRLSRRLIFIITPGRGARQRGSSAEVYDVQVGLHQALVQGHTGVILIQLEDMHNYTHLPLGLQHLLKKSPPLLWRDGGKPGSRFWKLVRYRMPVPSRRVKKTSAGLSYQTDVSYAIV